MNYITFFTRPFMSILSVLSVALADLMIAFGASSQGVVLGSRPYVRLVWLWASDGVMPMWYAVSMRPAVVVVVVLFSSITLVIGWAGSRLLLLRIRLILAPTILAHVWVATAVRVALMFSTSSSLHRTPSVSLHVVRSVILCLLSWWRLLHLKLHWLRLLHLEFLGQRIIVWQLSCGRCYHDMY